MRKSTNIDSLAPTVTHSKKFVFKNYLPNKSTELFKNTSLNYFNQIQLVSAIRSNKNDRNPTANHS